MTGQFMVQWANPADHDAPRRYSVLFEADSLRQEFGNQQHKILVGDEDLVNFLIERQAHASPLEERTKRANGCVEHVNGGKVGYVRHVELTDGQADEFYPPYRAAGQ